MSINDSHLDYPKCLHCEGSGLCHQSITTITKKRAVYRTESWRDSDGGFYNEKVLDYTCVWEKRICKICGDTNEAQVAGEKGDETIFQEPEQLICQVCGGSGYIGIMPYFCQQKKVNSAPDNEAA